MLSRSTLALAAAALVTGGGYLIYDSIVVPRQETAEAEAKDLFAFEEAEIQSLELVTEQATLAFTRSPQTENPDSTPSDPNNPDPNNPDPSNPDPNNPDPSNPNTPEPETPPAPPPADWQMIQPLSGPANDASIAFLLNLITTGASSRTFTVPVDRAAEFGLDTPTATLTLTLTDGSTHRLILGNPDFDRTSLYAQVDPPDGATELTLRLVPTTFEQAVGRPLDDWQQATDLDTDNIQGLEDVELPPPAEPPSSPPSAPPSAPASPPSDSPSQPPSDSPSQSPSDSPSQPQPSPAQPQETPPNSP